MTETEIKLAVSNPRRVRLQLRRLGWRAQGRRMHERNYVYDRPDHSLRAGGYLLRVREVGKRCWLTVKRPRSETARHKVQEEFEIETRGASNVKSLIETLGFEVAWRYEKYRTEFRRDGEEGKILLDVTPIGDFLELEGPPSWIDRTARRLGFSEDEYINRSYGELFRELQRTQKNAGPDMTFESLGPSDRGRSSRAF